MKKFRFRLDPILKLKEHFEKERQKDLAAALQQVSSQESALVVIHQDRVSTINRQSKHIMGKLSASNLLIHSRYLLRLKADTMTGDELLLGLNETVKEKREKLALASRDKKIFKKLKEKLFERHHKEINKLEAAL